MRQAIQRQMVADVPLGAFLSGGLDSSSIVAFAREQNPDIHCFTIEAAGGQEEGAIDDLPYARMVAQHLGVPLEVVRIDAGRMAGDLERMVAQLDEPLADPAPLNKVYISRLARERGMKVLLSEAGGDDLFTGYRRHRAVQFYRSHAPAWECSLRRSSVAAKTTKIIMGRSPYSITEPDKPHFMTCTVVEWPPIFTRPETVKILLDCWRYQREHASLRLYGYVVLENHLHFIAQAQNLNKCVSSFKSFTARQIIYHLQAHHVQQSLERLRFAKRALEVKF